MKILVLGSQGFIGSYLVNYLISKGYVVTGCDLYDLAGNIYTYHKVSVLSPDFEAIFEDTKFDICINTSGSGNVPFSIRQPFSDFEANTVVVAKILDSLRKYNPQCKYLHISSAAVYGNPAKLPVSEKANMSPVSPYGFHKLMAEITCREYYELYKVPVAIIRPFSVFGNGLKKQLLWDIAQKLSQNNKISLFGTGEESRDFIHISDLVSLIEIVAEKAQFTCDIYNAASGTEIFVKEIAEIYIENFPGAKRISFSGEIKEGDPGNWKADITTVRTLGFSPIADLRLSVIDYINEYCRHANR